MNGMNTDTSGRAPLRFGAMALVRGRALAAIEAAIDARAHRLDVTYHARLGYPVSVYVTGDPAIADDSWGASVTDLAVLSRAP